jgi:hypothetical protein
LTPKQLKGDHRSSYVVEKADNDGPCRDFHFKEKDRKEKRNQARDQNRPFLDSDAPSSPEYENMLAVEDDSDEWLEEEEEDEVRKPARGHDTSLEYIRRRENWNTIQRNSRRSHFNKNRRSSIEHSRKSVRTSDDWARFQSCVSLEDTSSADFPHGPKKSLTRNFIFSHHAQVNRMSDIYVNSRSMSEQKEASAGDKKYSWLEVKKILGAFTIALIAIFWTALKK